MLWQGRISPLTGRARNPFGCYERRPEQHLNPLSDYTFQEGAVGDAVEVAVFGAEDDGGVAELLDGALDAVHGDLISHGYVLLDVAAGGDVAGEGDEALAQAEGGDEADGG